ncbi:plant cysteine oxidase 2 [Morus notabilis]|uniref:plant cysteine oxidase 2 n=1 Tax=Morus notabilis TaxID=981085 RepID=UPI000CED6FE6|nr:plant cysteine oxidase 2 [Morus notabilis]
MGIETALANRKGKEFCELPKVTNSNSKTRKNRRRYKKMSPVQKLFEMCKEVFTAGATGVVPPPEDIQRLQSVLDVMKPEDVGLTPELPYFRANAGSRTPAITYLHLHECENFSMGIFCLPPSGVIPLHNHPGMTVFSKLLFGTMHIKSYDWVVDVPSNTSATVNSSQDTTTSDVRLAKVKVDSDFTAPCNASILYPADGGNMHCFTAVTACAVLDVLGPPYSDPDGRHCTYYHDRPFSDFSVDGVAVPEEEKESHAWLQEREILPEDLAVVGAPYRGPKIVN